MKAVVRFATLGALLAVPGPVMAQAALPLKHAAAPTKTVRRKPAARPAGKKPARPIDSDERTTALPLKLRSFSVCVRSPVSITAGTFG